MRFTPPSQQRGGKIDNSPESIFYYIYAIFFSVKYRIRYVEFLKIDYPRIPIPSTLHLYDSIVTIGNKLVSLHLLRPTVVISDPAVKLVGEGNNIPSKITWKKNAVWINSTQYFDNISKEIWEFVYGGYQVCHKWLKDRKTKGGKKPHPGRILTVDDICHYQQIISTIDNTIRLQAEIDKVIDQHGGWPDAFVTSKPEDDA